LTIQLETGSNPTFTRPAFMNRPKGDKGKGLVFGNASVYYDLGTVAGELGANSQNPARALQAGKRSARFGFRSNPAHRVTLVDEGMGFPVTLATALRTGAVYEGLDLAKPSSLRYIGAEFFREFLRLLVPPALTLLYRQGYNFNWSNLGLVLQVARGIPTGLGFFSQAAVSTMDYTQPLLISPGNSDCPGSGPGSPSFGLYKNFASVLLAYGLRPLVAELAGLGVRAEVLWDIAIETLFETAQGLGIPQEARQGLFIEELAAANLNESTGPTGSDTLSPKAAKFQKGFSFNQGQVIFLKQHCCEKYRRKTRCSNCPANRKTPPMRLPLTSV
jgi:hypothetical protein